MGRTESAPDGGKTVFRKPPKFHLFTGVGSTVECPKSRTQKLFSGERGALGNRKKTLTQFKEAQKTSNLSPGAGLQVKSSILQLLTCVVISPILCFVKL